MKTLNFKQSVYLFRKYLKWHFLPLIILFFSITEMTAQQVIGTFPYMNGGFEGQTAGALGTTLSTTSWSRQNQSGASSSIATTSPRTGLNYAAVTNVTTVSRGLQSPQLATFVAGTVPAANTKYVVQYWVRNAATVASWQVGVSINGTSSPIYSPTPSPPSLAVNAGWTKQIANVTTPSGALTAAGLAIIGRSAAGSFDVDDVCIYFSSTFTTDVTAPNAPTAPTQTAVAATQQTISWTAASGGVDLGGYMVVRGTTDPTTVPNANGIYAVGNAVAAGEQVVYLGTATSFVDIGLTQSSTYYYRIYTVDKAFNYSTPVSLTAATSAPAFDTEPTAQASSVSFSSVGITGLTINWTVGDGSNSLVVVKQAASVLSDPVDGNTYSTSTVFGSGSQIGTGNYVVYKGAGNSVAITGLSRNRTYDVKVYSFNGSAGTENFLTTTPGTGSQLTLPGEISSAGLGGSSFYNTVSTWVGGIVPTADDNITIVSPDQVNYQADVACNNVTINSGAKLYCATALPLALSSIKTLMVYGSSLVCNGTFGDKSLASPTLDCGSGIGFAGSLTISGTGVLRPAVIRPLAGLQNATLTLDADVELTHAGAAGTGGTGLFTTNTTSDNITVTVNSGKTLSFLPYCNFSTTSTATNGVANTTININGTVNVSSTGSLSLLIASGKTCTLNVDGTLSTGDLFATSASGGAAPSINVGPSGSITVSRIADFSSTTLSGYVAGSGSFTLASGSSINIAANSGLEPALGPIRTSTHNFHNAANYSYVGSSAQVTGSDLPGTVNNLTINNAAGVSLSGAKTVNGTLILTSGTLSLGANDLTIGAEGSISGASATNYIVTDGAGKLNQSIGAATAKLFPIGISTSSYDPAMLTPTDATIFAAKVSGTISNTPDASSYYNAREWNLTPSVVSSTTIALTPSVVREDLVGFYTVVGHYYAGSWYNHAATKDVSTYTATTSTFSPFTTGTTDIAVGANIKLVSKPNVYATSGQIVVENELGKVIDVYSLTGSKVRSIKNNSNKASISIPKGIYIISVDNARTKVFVN